MQEVITPAIMIPQLKVLFVVMRQQKFLVFMELEPLARLQEFLNL